MTQAGAGFWLIGGLVVSVGDAWLSMQAMFGIINPRNALQWIAAIAAGLAFTLFAVLAEPLRLRRTARGAMFWLVMVLCDVATSVLCAIWYGQFGQPFDSRIDTSRMSFDITYWQVTGAYVLLVALFAYGCIQFGRAIEFFFSKK